VLTTNGSGLVSWANAGSGSSQWTTSGSGSDIYYNGSGNVGIKTTTPRAVLDVNGSANFANGLVRVGSDGNLQIGDAIDSIIDNQAISVQQNGWAEIALHSETSGARFEGYAHDAGSDAQLRMENDSSDTGRFIKNGTANGATEFGQDVQGGLDIVDNNNTSGTGMAIGTEYAGPIYFGTNNKLGMELDQNGRLYVGDNLANNGNYAMEVDTTNYGATYYAHSTQDQAKLGLQSDDPNSTANILMINDTGNNSRIWKRGSHWGTTVFGIGTDGAAGFIDENFTSGNNGDGGLFLGTGYNAPIYFGTNNNLQMIVSADGHVGIGATNPSEKLEVNGGIRLNTTDSKPACDATTRGTTWFTQGGAGVKDSFEVCAKSAADIYDWRTIY
jgi:hypothetical protein